MGGDHKGFLGAMQSTLDLRLSGNEPEDPKAEHSFSRVGAEGSIEQKAQSNEAAWQLWECGEVECEAAGWQETCWSRRQDQVRKGCRKMHRGSGARLPGPFPGSAIY